MKKLALLLISLTPIWFSCTPTAIETDDCKGDVEDTRWKIDPWNKGAWQTDAYRNVFLDAGYPQEEIDAKLAKAYADLLKDPTSCILKWKIL
ncbi:hypothetical protein R9C00_18495 [Flammeovirgaceae bacterium SG7u.111]|nr:hypothetical protein [Flammeovirgaceae bacterium SG7u.132]WPO33693.1 hypothetical protein R9C00_18495 [Flammeovirgaceae bacterium SG7u.111]